MDTQKVAKDLEKAEYNFRRSEAAKQGEAGEAKRREVET
jgi:hypothetical protein